MQIFIQLLSLRIEDVVMVFFLFFCQEDEENKISIQEALSLMSEAFRSIEAGKLHLLEALIMQNIEKVADFDWCMDLKESFSEL